jgi:hypothetical protein
MRRVPPLLALFVVTLLFAGCAESSSTPDHDSSAALSIPDKSDSPPVTMSGYVDTSATTQFK